MLIAMMTRFDRIRLATIVILSLSPGCRPPSEAEVSGVGIGKAEPGPECQLLGTVQDSSASPETRYLELRKKTRDMGGNYVFMAAAQANVLFGRAYRCPSGQSAAPATSTAGHRFLIVPMADAPPTDGTAATSSGKEATLELVRALERKGSLATIAQAPELASAFEEAARQGSAYVIHARLSTWTSYQMRPNEISLVIDCHDPATRSLVASQALRLAGAGTEPSKELLVRLLDGSLAPLLATLPPPGAAGPSAAQPLPPPGGSQAAVCVPGSQIECACVGGSKGAQVCAADGRRYEQCQCAQVAPAPPK
jgi:hypothetical protein